MATAIKIKCLPEPELQFSNGRRDIDPRRALAANGPADHRGLRTIRVGLVGLADEVSAARAWIASWRPSGRPASATRGVSVTGRAARRRLEQSLRSTLSS